MAPCLPTHVRVYACACVACVCIYAYLYLHCLLVHRSVDNARPRPLSWLSCHCASSHEEDRGRALSTLFCTHAQRARVRGVCARMNTYVYIRCLHVHTMVDNAGLRSFPWCYCHCASNREKIVYARCLGSLSVKTRTPAAGCQMELSNGRALQTCGTLALAVRDRGTEGRRRAK